MWFILVDFCKKRLLSLEPHLLFGDLFTNSSPMRGFAFNTASATSTLHCVKLR